MAFQFDPNQTPIDGAAAVFQLVTNLVAAGWSIYAYGNGVVRTAGGAGFVVASLRDIASAWVEVKAPDGSNRTITFQRSAAGVGDNTAWWVAYTEGGCDALGTGVVVDGPTVALDTKDVHGTVGAPATLFPVDNALGAFRCSTGADNATPYGAWMAAWNIGTGEARTLLFFDKANGPSTDPEPFVLHADYKAAAPWAGQYQRLSAIASAPLSWYERGLAGAAWARTLVPYFYTESYGIAVPTQASVDPVEGKDALALSIYVQDTAGVRYFKGATRMVAYTCFDRPTGHTFDPDGAGDDRVQVGHISLPWPAGVAAVV